MNYQSETIQSILSHLNVTHFLPAIQREYVWHPDQIIQLFDSIMRKYPISSFLFWQLDEENHYTWDVYKFVQNFNEAGTHNESADIHGVPELTLVLDGQQRLTSLLIGLKGTFTSKKKYIPRKSPGAWVKQRLYLDLLQDPGSTEEETEEGIRYGFRFMEVAPTFEGTQKQYWFAVGRILDFKTYDKFEKFLEQEADKLPDTFTKAQVKVFSKNLTRLYQAIWEDYSIAYYTEHDQNYDRVLTIFVRANQGGTKLSKSDLLLSMITAKWGVVNARDEIYDFVDHLNNQLTHKNDFDKDFIMKTCLVLSDLPVQYKVANFNNSNLTEMYNKWQAIKVAIEATVILVNTFGIDRDTLTSANALIPIIYYFYRHPSITLLGGSRVDVRNAAYIHRWLVMALLNNAFSGQSDTALNDTRKAVSEHARDIDFPANAINAELRRSGRKTSFDEETIDVILGFTYGKSLTFLALSLLYDENNWGITNYHQDHIFPQALFTLKYLNSIGLNPERQKRYLELANRIGNLELLSSPENLEKSSKDFKKWLGTRDSDFKKRHLIPNDDSLLLLDRFEEFITTREELIIERLKAILQY